MNKSFSLSRAQWNETKCSAETFYDEEEPLMTQECTFRPSGMNRELTGVDSAKSTVRRRNESVKIQHKKYKEYFRKDEVVCVS